MFGTAAVSPATDMGDASSPLLNNNNDDHWTAKNNNNFHQQYKEDSDPELARTQSTSTTPFSYDGGTYDINGGGPGGGLSFDNDEDDEHHRPPSCCPQLLKSTLAILLALGALSASIICIVYQPIHPLDESIVIYVMCGLCILNCVWMIRNEKYFMFTLPSKFEGGVCSLCHDEFCV